MRYVPSALAVLVTGGIVGLLIHEHHSSFEILIAGVIGGAVALLAG